MSKRLFLAILAVVTLGFSMFSCTSPDHKVSVIAFGNKVQNITFADGVNEKVELIYFTENWSCDNASDWLEVTPMTHVAKNAGQLDSLRVTFRTLSLTPTERRTGVTFSQDGATVRIPVIQQAAPAAN